MPLRMAFTRKELACEDESQAHALIGWLSVRTNKSAGEVVGDACIWSQAPKVLVGVTTRVQGRG